MFSNEKDLRHHEAIRIKASHYTGIALRVKVITPSAMENLLYAMDLDSGEAKKKKEGEGDGKGGKGKDGKDGKDAKGKDGKDQPAANDNTAGAASLLASLKQQDQGIVNLSFEECKFTRKAAILFSEWLKSNSVI